MELTKEQDEAFELMKSGKNIFLTGIAGSGKGIVIQKFYNYTVNLGYNISKTSTTGVSALLINGRTIHSWGGIGYGDKSVKEYLFPEKGEKGISWFGKNNWKNCRILIIDEISMLSEELFIKLDSIAKSLKRNNKPFGGIQVIFVGDFLQLPAVKTRKFCFESKLWNLTIDKSICLKTNMRQESDLIFQDMLNDIRYGNCSDLTDELLQSRVGVVLKNEYNIEPTRLYSRKSDVKYMNDKKYRELKIEKNIENIYNAVYSVDINNTSKSKSYYINMMKERHIIVDDVLKLRKNTQIVFKINTKYSSHPAGLEIPVANGTRGIVKDFTEIDKTPIVKLLSGIEIIVTPHKFEYEVNNEFLITKSQFPIRHAWACTIHSSQGMSLDYVIADIGESIFEYGQTYVVLSRVKTLKGLSLLKYSRKKIMANPTAIAYYSCMD